MWRWVMRVGFLLVFVVASQTGATSLSADKPLEVMDRAVLAPGEPLSLLFLAAVLSIAASWCRRSRMS